MYTEISYLIANDEEKSTRAPAFANDSRRAGFMRSDTHQYFMKLQFVHSVICNFILSCNARDRTYVFTAYAVKVSRKFTSLAIVGGVNYLFSQACKLSDYLQIIKSFKPFKFIKRIDPIRWLHTKRQLHY